MGREQTWLDDFHEGRGRIYSDTNWLREMADFLDIVGNEKLARQLRECAESIREGIKQMDNAVNRNLNDQVCQGEKAIHDIFLAVLESVDQKEQE